jgi:hypothetical protein
LDHQTQRKFNSGFFDITYDNSLRDDSPGLISSYTLNRHFEFVLIGDGPTVELMYGNSTGHAICRTRNIAGFVSHFVHLDIGRLCSIAWAHELNADNDKPILLQTLMRHVCSDGQE